MATIKFRLSTKPAPDSGKAEIMVRFFHGKLDQYGKTNLFIDPARWNPERQRATIPRKRGIVSDQDKALASDLSRINASIEEISSLIIDSFNADGAGKRPLPSSWLRDLLAEHAFPDLSGRGDVPRTVTEALEVFIAGKTTSRSNVNHCRVLARAFRRYEIFSGCGPLDLDGVTPETLRNFARYLREEHTYYRTDTDREGGQKVVFLNPRFRKALAAVPESRLPEPRGENALWELMKHFRTFFHWAADNGITDNNPFKKYRLPQPLYGTPYYLTLEELHALAAFDFSAAPAMARQRDVFVFQCSVGCRVSDLKAMGKESIISGAVEYIPRKTKEGNPHTVRVPLNATAREILDKYKDLPGKRLLPCISEQQYNKAIKEIFRAAGIVRTVTVLNPTTREEEKRPLYEIASSHLARRTFCGNLYKRVKDPNMVGKLSGHTEGSRAFARYRDIDEDMMKDVVSILD